MDNYIQFPRYSIYLIPNKLFIDQVEKLLFSEIILKKYKIVRAIIINKKIKKTFKILNFFFFT